MSGPKSPQVYDTIQRLCLLQLVTELLQQAFLELSGQGSCAELDEQWPAIAVGLRRWDEEAAMKLAAGGRGGGRGQQEGAEATTPGTDQFVLQQQPPGQLQGEELQEGVQGARPTGANSGSGPGQNGWFGEQHRAPEGRGEGERGQWQERDAQHGVHAEAFAAGQEALAIGGSSPPPAFHGGAVCGATAAAPGGGDGGVSLEAPCPPVDSKQVREEFRAGPQGGDSALVERHSSPPPPLLSPKSVTPEAVGLLVRCAGAGRHGATEPGRDVGRQIEDGGQYDGQRGAGGEGAELQRCLGKDGAGLPGGSSQAAARRQEEQQQQQHDEPLRAGEVAGRVSEDVRRKRPRDQKEQEGGELHGPGDRGPGREPKRGRSRERERGREKEGKRRPEREGSGEPGRGRERERKGERERERERGGARYRERGQERERSGDRVGKEAGRSPVRDRARDRERDGSGGGDRRERPRSPPRNSSSSVEQWAKDFHAWLVKQPNGQATSQDMIGWVVCCCMGECATTLLRSLGSWRWPRRHDVLCSSTCGLNLLNG